MWERCLVNRHFFWDENLSSLWYRGLWPEDGSEPSADAAVGVTEAGRGSHQDPFPIILDVGGNLTMFYLFMQKYTWETQLSHQSS